MPVSARAGLAPPPIGPHEAKTLDGELKVFAGSSNRALAEHIAARLDQPLGSVRLEQFPDGEARVQINENVRGTDVFVIQSTSAPVDEHLMQLLIMIDALRRASAGRITAVIPYFGYARQEKKSTGREPITAKLVANLLEAAGANRVMTLDLHAPAVQGFFDIPVDHLQASPLLADALRRVVTDDLVVVSPDAGGVARAYDFSKRLDDASLAVVFKDRMAPDEIQTLTVVGEVAGRTAVIVDDLISTGGTLAEGARALLDRGANAIYACAIHGVFANGALPMLEGSGLQRVFVTDSIPLRNGVHTGKIAQVATAQLFAEAVRRVHNDESITALFE